MTCRDEAHGDWKDEIDHCMPGGCYDDPESRYGAHCRVPLYTCPAGVTGYRCLGDRRIYCEANGLARDHDDCATWPNDPGAPEMHCVEDPAGGLPGCGYTTERCTTPGEVMCLGNGTVTFAPPYPAWLIARCDHNAPAPTVNRMAPMMPNTVADGERSATAT